MLMGKSTKQSNLWHFAAIQEFSFANFANPAIATKNLQPYQLEKVTAAELMQHTMNMLKICDHNVILIHNQWITYKHLITLKTETEETTKVKAMSM